MKVVIITNIGTTFSLPVIKEVYQSEKIELKNIFFCNNLRKKSRTLRQLFNRYGLSKIMKKIFSILDRGLRTFLSRLFRIKVFKNYKYSIEYATARKIPLQIVNSINSPDTLRLLNDINPDIILMCSFSQILSKEVLDIPKKACINIHPSILPKHRGPVPIFWTLFYGDKEAGYTYHIVNKNIDSGKILARFTINVGNLNSEKLLTKKISSEIGKTVEKTLVDFYENKISPIIQDRSESTYESYPSLDQRKKFRRGLLN